MKTYDAIVIGSGQAGTPLSKKLAHAGLKTLLIEQRLIGGTCINDGCTPTKTMIASAKLASQCRRSNELGINIPSFTVDLAAIKRRKDDVVERFRNGAERGLLKTENLELLIGHAAFSGIKRLRVVTVDQEIEVAADKIFINTGTVPDIPNIPGLQNTPYFTSTTILDLTGIPKHLLVLGSGYVGLEIGQMFRRFGSKVSMVEKKSHLLPKEDTDVADCIEDFLTNEGIQLYKNCVARSFSTGPGGITFVADHAADELRIEASHLLIAVGRSPATKVLHLDKTGVQVNEKGFIVVDEYLETSQPGIYALGEVNGGRAFTHIAYNDHLIVLKNLLDKKRCSVKGRILPYCMFTDPQLGRVGITEAEARKQGLNFRVATLPMEKVARAIETGETTGKMKVIVDADTKQILGAAIIGSEGGEIMSVLQMAIMNNTTYDVIRETVFAHPLYAESLNNLFMELDN